MRAGPVPLRGDLLGAGAVCLWELGTGLRLLCHPVAAVAAATALPAAAL